MGKEKAMIVDIPFNSESNPFWPGFTELYNNKRKSSQTKKWIDYRIDIFIKYTALSLINQTNQNFKCIVRYSKQTEDLILESLSRYNRLPENIIFTSDGDNFIENYIKDYKYIYHIRIDSDNMYSDDFIQNLYDVQYYDGLECILCQSGYIYDLQSDRIAKMFHGSPSFYALTYTVDDFLVGFRHNTEPDHWGAVNLVNFKIESPSYLVLVHNENLSNDFKLVLDYPFIDTTILSDVEKDYILKSFNLID